MKPLSAASVPPTEALQVTMRRRPLQRLWKSALQGHLTAGFLGGSITDGASGINWPEPVIGWLLQTFREVRLKVENAAIGATGSDSACLRARSEIIERGCDVTFVEYAVNDNGHPTQRRGRSREGLIRQLLAAGQEVVLVYTFCPEMRGEMESGLVPPGIEEFETLAEHYGLSSVWVGLQALREVNAGTMTAQQWLPDGLHPSREGSELYGRAVTDFLKSDWEQFAPTTSQDVPTLPAPLDELHWESMALLPLEEVEAKGSWLLRRIHTSYHVQQVWETHAEGTILAWQFEGRGLVLICDFGHASADFFYRLDNQQWQLIERERPDWCGDRGLVRAFLVADDLPLKRHRFELKTVAYTGKAGVKQEFRLAHIGVLK